MRAAPRIACLLLSGFLLAALSASSPALEPRCPVEVGGCWIELANHPDCHVWVWEGRSAHEWSGGCMDGLASGEGILSSGKGLLKGILSAVLGNWDTSGEGSFIHGKQHGRWTERGPLTAVEEGPYVDGKRHGQWTERDPRGAVWEGPYVDGKRHGRWTTRFADGECVEVEWNRGEQVGRSEC